MELEDFAHQFNSDVQDRADNGAEDGPFSEQIFTGMVLDHLEDIGMLEEHHLCHIDKKFRNSTIRLNAYAFPDEQDQLDLFVTLFRDQPTPEPVLKDELNEAVQQAARFFKAVLKGNFAAQVDPSDPAFDLANTIFDRSANITTVRIFVLTDGLTKDRKPKPIADTKVTFVLEVIDIERLFRSMQAGQPRDEIEVDFVELVGHTIPCVNVPEGEAGEYSACLAVFPGDVLATLYEQYGPRLLELNVRSFLSVTGKINKGIRETLKTRPDRFLAYNNGIVVTVDELELERNADGQDGIRYIKGMQIVNGGQTTASLQRARKNDKADLSQVFVPAKITKIRAEKLDEMVSMISRFANSQNTVQPADFSANDPFHVEVEKLASKIWCPDQQGKWFYERARGSYQVALARDGSTPAKLKKLKESIPPQRRFSKPELAKYIHAWDQKPQVVSLGSQKNFDSFMQGMKKQRIENWLPDDAWYRELIAKAILFRETQRQVLRLSREQKITAQPANVSTYLVSWLAFRTGGKLDFGAIWKRQDLSPQLKDLIQDSALVIDRALRESAKGKMISEWAKKDGCWDFIKAAKIDVPDQIPEITGK